VFNRDPLQHFPWHAAWQFLNNVKASGTKWLLVGSYVKSPHPNVNIQGGKDVYGIDLPKEPFLVREPVEIIAENDEEGKHMLLFDVASMNWQETLQDVLK
jgi:hypothetical protein